MNVSTAARLSTVLFAGVAATPAAPRFAHVKLSTGVQLHYAVQGDSAGDPIILLHGYSDSWYSFSGVLPLLPGSYRVFALDLRGHGDSDSPASGYQMADMAADVIAFMDAQHIGRAAIVGHSMGSIVAQQVALLAPRRVSNLVLIGSGTTVRNVSGILELKEAVDSLPDPAPAAFLQEFQASTIYSPLPDSFMQHVIAASGKLSGRVWRDVMSGMLATGPALSLGMAGIPTLVVWGERDTLFLRAEQDALLAMLGTATFKAYPETGHALHWERPEEFAADLQSFLSATAYQPK